MFLSRRLVTALALAPFAPAAHAATTSSAPKNGKGGHRVAVHINYRDPGAVNLALNNVQNLYDYFRTQDQNIDVRIVAHGPGLHMFREDTSTVKDRLASMKASNASLSLAACSNTRNKMEKDEGQKIPLISTAEVVASGVVELVLLEERGWSYLRP